MYWVNHGIAAGAWIFNAFAAVGNWLAGQLPLNNGHDLYAEGGFGTMLYWHPRTQRPRMAFGPVLGIGLTWKELSFGFHGMWSPPAMQSESSGAPDVIAASFTVRKVWRIR